MTSHFSDDAQQQRYAEWISAQFLRGQSSDDDLQDELDGGYDAGACKQWDEENTHCRTFL